MQCEEWDDANSELFKESHDEAVHKNSYKSRLYELISASLGRHHHPLNPLNPMNPLNPGGEAAHRTLFIYPILLYNKLRI